MEEIEDVETWLKQWFYDKDQIDDLIGDIQEYVNR